MEIDRNEGYLVTGDFVQRASAAVRAYEHRVTDLTVGRQRIYPLYQPAQPSQPPLSLTTQAPSTAAPSTAAPTTEIPTFCLTISGVTDNNPPADSNFLAFNGTFTLTNGAGTWNGNQNGASLIWCEPYGGGPGSWFVMLSAEAIFGGWIGGFQGGSNYDDPTDGDYSWNPDIGGTTVTNFENATATLVLGPCAATTAAPSTAAPTTPPPTTQPPSTAAPTTKPPTTAAPTSAGTTAAGTTPAPTTAAPAFTASGAGTSSANGGYNANGTYGVYTAYENSNGDWIIFTTSGEYAGHWILTTGKGSGTTLYAAATSGSSTSNITGSWNVAGGTSPAPTIVSG
ncbi:MAG: hypothetical protein ABSA67_11335 [Candidatus Brocadiia bacterium]